MPATHMAMIVRTIVQTAMADPKCAMPKMATAKNSNTVQMAAKMKAPPHTALQSARCRARLSRAAGCIRNATSDMIRNLLCNFLAVQFSCFANFPALQFSCSTDSAMHIYRITILYGGGGTCEKTQV